MTGPAEIRFFSVGFNRHPVRVWANTRRTWKLKRAGECGDFGKTADAVIDCCDIVVGIFRTCNLRYPKIGV